MDSIKFKNIKKAYGETVIMENIDLAIEKGERLILLGPSGCGKSTMLRMIAGFEEITDGELIMNGQKVNDLAPGKRNVAMVFQNYALYPHMTVEDNITYGLKTKKVPKKEIEKRLKETAESLQLIPYLDRKPKDLSGGQRQRVALARAVVKESDFFLLDEPLSNLDAQLRVSARQSLMEIHEKFKQTMVYVTHDQIEAMTFGQRIALLNKGEIQMFDTPENVYHRPANIFTATFIGNPPTNILENVHFKNGAVHFGNQVLKLTHDWAELVENSPASDLVFGIRPEHIQLLSEKTDNTIRGKVRYTENQGSSYAVYIQVEGQDIIVLHEHNTFKNGQEVFLQMQMDHIHFFNKKTTKNIGYPESVSQKKKESSGFDFNMMK